MNENTKVFFTSDTHFGHKNILGYCNRPFADIVKMNRELIAKWNATVSINDVIYHLGDFALTKGNEAQMILSKLNGFKILVKGNHDKDMHTMAAMGFDAVCGEAWHKDYKWRHIPWKLTKGQKGLCGNVHEKWTRVGNLINVGVDRWDFTPRLLKELEEAKQTPGMRVDKGDMLEWRKQRTKYA